MKYRPEHDQFLKQHQHISRAELAAMFNKKFGTNISVNAMGKRCLSLGLSSTYTWYFKLTDEHIQYLRDHQHLTRPVLLAQFNAKFSANLTMDGLSTRCYRLKIKSTAQKKPNSGCFNKGLTPWNKGKKGLRVSPASEFKKGNLPAQTKPVGSMRRTLRDNILQIKIANPKVWRDVHKLIYEEHHGPIPKGHVIIFLDGDKNNFDVQNLACISRGVHSQMCRDGVYKLKNVDLKETHINVYKLKEKIRTLAS
jgi:hypothetical protein